MEALKATTEDWVGSIPESWGLERMRYSLNEINVKNSPIKTEQILSLVKDKGVMLYEEKGDVGNKAKEDITGYKVAFPNTLIVNSMNILIGSVGISNYKGCVSPVYYVFKETEKSDLRYINYIFNTREFQKELRKYAKGILEIRLRVSASDIFNRKLPMPTKDEQTRIADFLDEKCAEIDRLSGDIQKQIEILEDYKKSVITRAVTKGLNPNTEMSDSGIKWIGKIPASWNIAPLKTFLDNTPNAIVDGPFGSDMKNEEYVSDGVPVIQLGSIRDYRMDFSKMHFITDEKADSLKRHNAFPQNVVIAKMMPAGKACEVPDKYARYVVSADVIRIIISNELIRRYIIYALNCCATVQAEIESQGSTRARVNIDKVKHFKIPKPPEESMQLIVDYLDKKCAIIENSIEVKKKQLNDLGVYKKSIIYEYVTGKKRVKGVL